jgi:intergrase/recombinase
LERFAEGRVIKEPLDVMEIFRDLGPGQIHHLDRALRALLNFCLSVGYPEDWITRLKRAIPKDPDFIDLRVPEEHEVLEGLRRLGCVNSRYRVVWLLCLESGLRLVEAVDLVNRFDQSQVTRLNGFCRSAQIASFRGSKSSYYAYFAEETLEQILGNDKVTYEAATVYFRKRGILRPKYLRKFAFHKMVELGVPESVADFIQGRTPRTVGARHYMNLVRQADQYYLRYAEYLRNLKEKAKN